MQTKDAREHLSLVDIAPLFADDAGARAATIRALDDALTSIGFVNLSGHGIEAATIDAVHKETAGFFAQPLMTKQRLSITRENYRGYIPLGFFSPNSGRGEADQYEGYKLHGEFSADDPICDACALYGPNRWPDVDSELRLAVANYWRACDRVTTVLMAAIAQILDVDVRIFADAFKQPLTNMTLLHYPASRDKQATTGIHAHKDTDVLTIISGEDAGELLVQRRDRSGWIQAATPPGALLVNVGDMLELWSGGYLKSTPHKVVLRPGRERYSFPYFAVPRYDTVVRPLAISQPGFSREPVHVGDITTEVWRTNWPDASPTDPALELGTLKD